LQKGDHAAKFTRKRKIFAKLQKDVDSLLTLPQYLVSRVLLTQENGVACLHSGPEVEGKKRSRRNLYNGNKEKGKKEEALTVCEATLARAKNFSCLSGEAPLERRFCFRTGTGPLGEGRNPLEIFFTQLARCVTILSREAGRQ